MRARPLTLLTLIAAVTLLLVCGCEAKVAATVYNAPEYRPVDRYSSQHQPQLAELMLEAMTPPGEPDTLPNFGFGALQARIQQATDEAAAAGATLSVAILDRATHQLAASGNTQIVGIASVAKLFIADDLLLQEFEGKTTLPAADRQALDIMLQSSDDGAAEKFWDQAGGAAIITRIASRYGLTATTPPSDGRWWNTMSSATDLIRYYDMLLDGSGGLPPDRAGIIVNDLAQSTPTGIDGYPQRFGIPDGLYAEPVAVKQGWMCCIGSDWMHLSTGVIGSDRRYIMVIQSLQPSDDATARQTVTQAVKTIFPNGRI
ncbi:lipoprotein LppW [Mycobacterium haemophilum]|uniref:Lipoprotein LppW n=1 Tax=Mycobacterium haemophilum TaxID=29311 RepID=A0A0I9UF47_9MYCO|nr:lipoprotein LppW [Mycobacterium haemophilum]AKN17647.1 hypothetical protein B586_15375 [Mycobacterium haemophilum DSM 44634]KLO29219.1 lipoprotein LppW [Mycobacterium haemophilum]KLO35823.1 lipoprotein LppW [Mycobacterium haemophilum]KLO41344.1 lipoprotein LppW [Mycobacterium haemophilum]KLO49225.1 lipoprotein LppW [Mycobacterium haemophilum]